MDKGCGCGRWKACMIILSSFGGDGGLGEGWHVYFLTGHSVNDSYFFLF